MIDQSWPNLFLGVSVGLILGACIIFIQKIVWSGDLDDESTNTDVMKMATKYIVADAATVFAYFSSGLIGVLIYRMVVLLPGLAFLRSINLGTIKFKHWARIATFIGLIPVLFNLGTDYFHIYGLVCFTLIFVVPIWRTGKKWLQDERGGTMAKIRLFGVFSITYALLVGLSEVLWLQGGVDYWIWFYGFSLTLAMLGIGVALFIVQPFLEASSRIF